MKTQFLKAYLQELAERIVRTARAQGYSALLWKTLWKLPFGRGIILKLLVVGGVISTSSWEGDIERAVEFTFSYNRFGLSIEPVQIRNEILDLCSIIDDVTPKTVLEIGTDRGEASSYSRGLQLLMR